MLLVIYLRRIVGREEGQQNVDGDADSRHQPDWLLPRVDNQEDDDSQHQRRHDAPVEDNRRD